VWNFPEHLSAGEKRALGDFLDRVRALLGDDLLDARLFGSRARGEGHETSDLDVALIVTPRGHELRRDIFGFTFDAAYDYGVEVGPVVITEDQLRELSDRELSIATAIEQESVRLSSRRGTIGRKGWG